MNASESNLGFLILPKDQIEAASLNNLSISRWAALPLPRRLQKLVFPVFSHPRKLGSDKSCSMMELLFYAFNLILIRMND